MGGEEGRDISSRETRCMSAARRARVRLRAQCVDLPSDNEISPNISLFCEVGELAFCEY